MRVLSAKARGHRDHVTVVGHAIAIAAGAWITASGEWVNGRTHNQQFKIAAASHLAAEFGQVSGRIFKTNIANSKNERPTT